MNMRPIGLFDSGIGGLSILQACRALLPNEHYVYLGDTAHFPYGGRSPEELRALSARIADWLLVQGCKLIVVACNTATVEALSYVRQAFPRVPFVGVVPVVKPLAERTRTGAIALLSTPRTAASPYLADLVARYAPDCRVVNVGCPGLADLVEAGESDTPRTFALLERYLQPILNSDVDVLGLGCTHYPFLRGTIERILGAHVRVYDSGLPVARRVQALLAEGDALAIHGHPQLQLYTTGDAGAFAALAQALLPATPTLTTHVDLPSLASLAPSVSLPRR